LALEVLVGLLSATLLLSVKVASGQLARWSGAAWHAWQWRLAGRLECLLALISAVYSKQLAIASTQQALLRGALCVVRKRRP
jgi:hypothetical protein